MGTIIKQEKTNITTSEGLRLIRSVSTFRSHMDYYEPSSGVTKVSNQELECLRIPTYKQLI